MKDMLNEYLSQKMIIFNVKSTISISKNFHILFLKKFSLNLRVEIVNERKNIFLKTKKNCYRMI